MNNKYLEILLFLVLSFNNLFSSDIINNVENEIYLSINSKVSKEYIHQIAFFNKKDHFFLVGNDNIIRLYDAENGTLLNFFTGYIEKKNPNKQKLFTIAIDNNDEYFATAGNIKDNLNNNSIIRIFDINTGKIVKNLEVDNKNISRLEFTKDGKYLISSGKNIIIWDAKTYEKIKTIEMNNFINAFKTINENLIAGDTKGNIFIISLKDNQILKQSSFSNVRDGEILRIESNGKDIIFERGYYSFLTDFGLEDLTYIGPFNGAIKLNLEGNKLFVNNGNSYYDINDKIKKNELRTPLVVNDFNEKFDGDVIEMGINENFLVTYDITNYKIRIRDLRSNKIINIIESESKRLNSIGINDNYLTTDLIRNKILTWESKHYKDNILEENRIKDHFPNAQKIYTSNSTINLNNLKYILKEQILNNVILENNSFKLSQSTYGDFIYIKSNDNVLYVNDKNDLFKYYIECINDIKSFSFFNNKIITGGEKGELKIFEVGTEEKAKLVSTLLGHNADIVAMSVYTDILVTLGADSIIKVWKINNEEYIYPLLNIFMDKENEFVIWTEEGYFSVSSPEALKYITWHMNQGYDKEAIRYDIGKFYDVFFRPDLVKLKLQGEDISKYTQGLTVKDALKNPPPEVKIINVDKKQIVNKNNLAYAAQIDTKKDNVNVKFNVSDFGGGVGTIRVYQEGKLIKTIGKSEIDKVIANVDTKIEEQEKEKKLSEYQQLALSKAINGEALKIDEQITNSFDNDLIVNSSGDYEINVALKNGLNQISIEAFNKTNTITSFRSTVNINANIPERKPKLYAIVAGVNNFESNYGNTLQNLKYAVNDAKSISDIASKSREKIFDDIEIISLIGNQVTKDNIEAAFENISKKASLEDTILFYISTHGISANSKFYLLPSNNAQLTNLIEFNDIFKKSSELKSLNQIFIIDACQSGSANDIASAVYDSRASVLARSSGIHLLSASTSGTYAFENNEYKHSNFTYHILDSMKNKETDKNKDGFISVIELSDKLRNLDSNEKQFPVIQNIGNDINLNKAY
ncbi:caspase family protein [Aliarcobacter butzleri]|uniref:caspase family protein n=2 Tax=Aliarcobacter butzleri TaxID=28197 RepID=UPI002B23FA5A|nr:caspase family protein [Aliarcobacter butzleri]